MSGTEKAAVIMLLLGEQQAADVIKYMAHLGRLTLWGLQWLALLIFLKIWLTWS